MGYLHIDGKGMQANGGSRYNDFEARTIAAWLAAHKEEIEHHYSKPLHELVGIVTPFSAQVSAIKSSLLKLDINCSGDENSLTVGTVHSLQGRNGQLCCSLLCIRSMKMADLLIETAAC